MQTAKEFWTELGAGKSDSIGDFVDAASAGKPSIDANKLANLLAQHKRVRADMTALAHSMGNADENVLRLYWRLDQEQDELVQQIKALGGIAVPLGADDNGNAAT
jgi:peptidoglycan hydrolase CwlO-like protein